VADMTTNDLPIVSDGESVVGVVAPENPVKSICVVFAIGCERLEAETGRLYEYIRINGWSIAATIEEADVVIVITCGYSADCEERCISLVHSVERRLQAGSQLVIGGCVPGINEERLQQVFNAVTVSSLMPPSGRSSPSKTSGILATSRRMLRMRSSTSLRSSVTRATAGR